MKPVSDREVEQLVGRLLQAGVLLAALVVLVGGLLLLAHHGREIPDFSVFHGEAAALRGVVSIVGAAFSGDRRAIVQLGLVLLIATPVARVALTLGAFLLQRDRLYAALTTVVLVLLVYGLVWGG